MIPATVDPACRSRGEQEIFTRLRDDPLTQDWVVLHSLDIAEHRKRIAGEADFVIIVPHKGILILEVKACTALRRNDQGWYYGKETHADARGPFKQASEAMHSLRERLGRNASLRGVLFWSAVAFPYVDFRDESPEWHKWQVIDGGAFRSKSFGALVLRVLESARAFLSTRPGTGWFHLERNEPTADQVSAIGKVLRPSFEYFESPESRESRLTEELKFYTEEQFLALDRMDLNTRVLFEGPAGTGKTLLAIEAARRSASAGRRVLLLCFNRELGRWLVSQTAQLQPLVETRTLHSQMLRVARLTPPPNPDSDYFEQQLPRAAIEELLETAQSDIFDEIIVDEAQDLMRDAYLDFLDLSLEGGLTAGRWRMFGDFERQSIFSPNSSAIEALSSRVAGFSQYRLRENCRNTPRIADYIHLLGRLNPKYSRILRSDDQIDPELLYYGDSAEQQTVLAVTLENLYTAGFRASDIMILSMRADRSCAATLNEAPWADRLRPLGQASQGQIPYSSVYAFKGLEAQAVIVTDVDRFGTEQVSNLLYIALSRATQRLTVLADKAVKAAVIKTIIHK